MQKNILHLSNIKHTCGEFRITALAFYEGASSNSVEILRGLSFNFRDVASHTTIAVVSNSLCWKRVVEVLVVIILVAAMVTVVVLTVVILTVFLMTVVMVTVVVVTVILTVCFSVMRLKVLRELVACRRCLGGECLLKSRWI